MAVVDADGLSVTVRVLSAGEHEVRQARETLLPRRDERPQPLDGRSTLQATEEGALRRYLEMEPY